jgi:hypothetical protein
VRNYKVHSALVYVRPGSRRRRYVVPLAMRSMILEYFHDSAISAHLGVNKTLRHISQVFYWPGLRNDVIKYCSEYWGKGNIFLNFVHDLLAL